jgi:rhomboid protease GluP
MFFALAMSHFEKPWKTVSNHRASPFPHHRDRAVPNTVRQVYPMSQPGRNSILCPNCRRLISLDESRCPYCETVRPGSLLKNNPLHRFLRDVGFIKIIIYINIFFYAASLLLGKQPPGLTPSPFTFLSPDYHGLLLLGATGTWVIDQTGRWWSLLTAGFLHASLLHIFFNMAALSRLAPLVQREYDTARTLLLYLATGVSGFLVSWVGGVPVTVGASASICGLIGALLYYGKSRGGVYGSAVYRHVSGWIVGLFVMGLLPGINNWGHGGGLLSGIALGYLLGYREVRKEKTIHRLLAATAVALTALALGGGLVSALIVRFST